MKSLLTENVKSLQHREFKNIVSNLINNKLQTIYQENFRNVFIILEYVSMIAYFVSTRQFPFIVNCYSSDLFRTYYTDPSSKTYYFAENLSKDKKEAIRKKRVKINYYGSDSGPGKSFTASASNFLQSGIPWMAKF